MMPQIEGGQASASTGLLPVLPRARSPSHGTKYSRRPTAAIINTPNGIDIITNFHLNNECAL